MRGRRQGASRPAPPFRTPPTQSNILPCRCTRRRARGGGTRGAGRCCRARLGRGGAVCGRASDVGGGESWEGRSGGDGEGWSAAANAGGGGGSEEGGCCVGGAD